jgi:N-acetylglucosamine-6-phosphate deacetylase
VCSWRFAITASLATGEPFPPRPNGRRLFGRVLGPDDLGTNVVTIEGDRIASIEPAETAPEDARSVPIIAPGFIDLQINGAFGQDFADPDADLALVCRSLPRHGVTAFVPTVVSSRRDRYAACLENLGRAQRTGEATVLGVHLEGPFINPDHAGAHDRAALRPPDRDEARAWRDAGNVRIVTLAPELPGALDVVGDLSAAGVVVAGGHSGASWAEAASAAAAGMRLGTHLFNAMRPLHHRDPGIVGFLLASEIPVSVIADGRHLARETLALVAGVKGADQVIAVTDALAALGDAQGDVPGEQTLGGRRVISDGAVASLPDGTIAGSVMPMWRMVANLVEVGVSHSAAVRAATANPARLLGMDAEIGAVRVGARADLAVLDDELRPIATYIGGELAWSSV